MFYWKFCVKLNGKKVFVVDKKWVKVCKFVVKKVIDVKVCNFVLLELEIYKGYLVVLNYGRGNKEGMLVIFIYINVVF